MSLALLRDPETLVLKKHGRWKSQVQNGMAKSSRENPGPATIFEPLEKRF